MFNKCICLFLIFALHTGFSFADPIRTSQYKDIQVEQPTTFPNQQLTKLEEIIIVTENNLCEQKELRKEVAEYQVLRRKYEMDMENQELSIAMMKQAHKILGLSQELNLLHAFDQDFISEITFFAGIIDRWNESPYERTRY